MSFSFNATGPAGSSEFTHARQDAVRAELERVAAARKDENQPAVTDVVAKVQSDAIRTAGHAVAMLEQTAAPGLVCYASVSGHVNDDGTFNISVSFSATAPAAEKGG